MKCLYSSASSSGPTPFTLAVTDRPVPTPPPGSLLIKIKAAGVNPSDAANAFRNVFQGTKPIIPGRDFAGTVEEVGSRVAATWVGREVYGTSGNLLSFKADGTCAEYVVVPENGVTEKPPGLSWAQAAAVGTPYSTALMALDSAHLRPGVDHVLVLGASGATGKAIVNLARALSCRTVLTASRGDTTDINLLKDSGLIGVAEKMEGNGPDVIIDAVGSSDLMGSAMQILAARGRYVSISSHKGSTPEYKLDMLALYRNHHTISGINSIELPIEQTADMMARLADLFKDGKLQPPDESELFKISIEEGIEAFQTAITFAGKKFIIVSE